MKTQRQLKLEATKSINDMKFRTATISILIGFTITSCDEKQHQAEVSIIDLIVSPEEYQGKQIITEGFLNIDGMPRLFVSRDDAIYKINSNSVRLSKSEFDILDRWKSCDQSYVQISGRFNQKLALESLQYVYTKELSSKLLIPCWGKLENKEEISNETDK